MKKKLAVQSTPAGVDLISNLLDDLINLILVRLPIRDAVRTSILSKKWRYKWVSIPAIVFDQNCLMEGASETDHAFVVDQVLMHHVGPIREFSSIYQISACRHIGLWIMFLSRNGIKKLSIKCQYPVWSYEVGRVPSSLFNCQELCHLELYHGTLKVPLTFKGFHNLLVLNLIIDISEHDIPFRIEKCPLLERLTLKNEGIFYQCLRIRAPNLRYFEFYGQFRDLSFGSSPLLTHVSMDSFLPPGFREIPQHSKTCSLVQFTGYFRRVERLALRGYFLQFLLVGDVPEKLSATYDHLKYLEIHIELNSKEILATLCILRSSPNLKELKIMYLLNDVNGRFKSSQEEAEFWGAKIQFDCLLSHLHVVEIIGLALLSDLVLLRYILSNAPALETVRVYTYEHVYDELSMVDDELSGLHFASAEAEIIYFGDYVDSYEV